MQDPAVLEALEVASEKGYSDITQSIVGIWRWLTYVKKVHVLPRERLIDGDIVFGYHIQYSSEKGMVNIYNYHTDWQTQEQAIQQGVLRALHTL